MYKVVQVWPGLIVCKQVTVCPGHIWTTLYYDDDDDEDDKYNKYCKNRDFNF
jgi:hypothetical protein